MSYVANQYNYCTPLSESHLLNAGIVTGAQLFDAASMPSTQTIAGVTFTNYADGSFSILGVPNNTYPRISYIATLPAGTYTVSAPGSTNNYNFRIRAGLGVNYTDTYIGSTVTYPVDTQVLFIIQAEYNRVYTGERFYPMVNTGATAKAWEAYNGGSAYPLDAKYLVLASNTLDGSYKPIGTDVGLWGTSVSDASGTLPVPFVLTIDKELTLDSLTIVGRQHSFPKAFTVQLYRNDTLIQTISEAANNSSVYRYNLPSNVAITRLVLTVSAISQPNTVASIYQVYTSLSKISSTDAFVVKLQENSSVKTNSVDILKCASVESSTQNVTVRSSDTVRMDTTDVSSLTNIHSVMKAISRQVFGKVYITYTDPLLDTPVDFEYSGEAYNSDHTQLTNGTTTPSARAFKLYDNDLSGRYTPADAYTQVGWSSSAISDANGNFATPQYMRLEFSARLIASFDVYFDGAHKGIPVDFTVTFIDVSNVSVTKTFVGNTSAEVQVLSGAEAMASIVAIIISISKVSDPFCPATIISVPILSTVLYVGYQDASDLISIDTLEELTYDDDIEALGGMSANEATIVLDNSSKQFAFNNRTAPVNRYMLRNRKVVPYLGAEVVPGEIEWHCLGIYWSYSWDVPLGSLSASVTAFDTLGLLNTTTFYNHQVQTNKSLGWLIDYILTDAKTSMEFITWQVDASLYDVTIPYAWFAYDSHTAALRRICKAYPMHIYCDRTGRIIAAPQTPQRDDFTDTWSDDTNVIDKHYKSLHATLPNIINVTVKAPTVVASELLFEETNTIDVSNETTRLVNFSKPYTGNLVVSIDKDASVNVQYVAYSWGAAFTFSGTGSVRSIHCTGSALDETNSSTYTQQDPDSIRVNGAITRDVSAEFIQKKDLAEYIASRLFALATYDNYDVEVTYRGDIATTINDGIQLVDTIGPVSSYVLKRNELSWNGALSGTADLNT